MQREGAVKRLEVADIEFDIRIASDIGRQVGKREDLANIERDGIELGTDPV